MRASAGEEALRPAAHGAQLPGLELVGGELGDGAQRGLAPLDEVAGGSTEVSATEGVGLFDKPPHTGPP